jgi:hypothetical protein
MKIIPASLKIVAFCLVLSIQPLFGQIVKGQKSGSLISPNHASKIAQAGAKPSRQILFDDFNYTNNKKFLKNGWGIRTAQGPPGVPGAKWPLENVSFLNDPEGAKNRILRMTSATDGTAENTSQTQICQQRKYYEGTYGARVRFTDNPLEGPGGDQLVQSFYTISPLKTPMDLYYSEMDFEYLPQGGWGINGQMLYATTWETFSLEPLWKKDKVFNTVGGSQAGWHTLLMQVFDGKVKYFLDGKMFAEHGGDYYPEVKMSINFNLWFIKEGLLPNSKAMRRYYEDIDWVFFEAKAVLKDEEVTAQVAGLRRRSVTFRDTVAPSKPLLPNPCNL